MPVESQVYKTPGGSSTSIPYQTYPITTEEVTGANAGQRPDLLAYTYRVYEHADGTLYRVVGGTLVVAPSATALSADLIVAKKGGTNGITVGDNSTNSGSALRMQGTSVGYNWQIDNNVNFAGLSISPSTTAGGTTYTTPVVTLTSSGDLTVLGPIKARGYTVSTLPAGVVGQRAYVTDALSPTFGAAVVGGGAVVIPVFRNASTWVVG